MKKVSAIVLDIIQKDPIACEALGRDLLNTNAYAREIQREVEKVAWRQVKVNTIVAALNRMRNTKLKDWKLVPEFHIRSISLKTGIVEMSFIKNKESEKVFDFVRKQKVEPSEYAMTLVGDHEYILITPNRIKDIIGDTFRLSSIKNGEVVDLAAVTLVYDSALTTEQPNVAYTLLRSLALKYINIVEIVSTFSEITFLVESRDADLALSSFKEFLK